MILASLSTKRLTLAVVGPEFALRVADYMRANHEHLQPWEPTWPFGFTSEAYWQRALQQSIDDFSINRAVAFKIFLGADTSGALIGIANFFGIARGAMQACTLGYSLHKDMLGNGYMHEALEAATRYMFVDQRLHRVMANYIPSNERSAAVLRRLGFAIEGTAKDFVFINGAWRDHVLTSLVNPDRAYIPPIE